MKVTISLLLSAMAALFLFGCSDTSMSPSGAATGRAAITITWPHATRVIPLASNSLVIRALRSGVDVVPAQIVARPSGGGVSTVIFPALPVGTVTLQATAYPETAGTGVAQASGSISIIIVAGQTTPFALTMNSTVSSISIQSTTLTMVTGTTMQLLANPINSAGQTVLVAAADLSWRAANGAGTTGGGNVVTVNSNGLVTALAAGTATVTVTEGDTNKTATVTLTVTDAPPNTIVVSPVSITLQPGATQAFTATLTGTANQNVTWSIRNNAAGVNAGMINEGGVLIAPKMAGAYTIRATSKADPTRFADAQVLVLPVLTVSPTNVIMPLGFTYHFTATLTPSLDPSLTWQVVEAGAGVIDNLGNYTAPMVAGTYHIIASSTAYPAVSQTLTVTVEAGSATIIIE